LSERGGSNGKPRARGDPEKVHKEKTEGASRLTGVYPAEQKDLPPEDGGIGRRKACELSKRKGLLGGSLYRKGRERRNEGRNAKRRRA